MDERPIHNIRTAVINEIYLNFMRMFFKIKINEQMNAHLEFRIPIWVALNLIIS